MSKTTMPKVLFRAGAGLLIMVFLCSAFGS